MAKLTKKPTPAATRKVRRELLALMGVTKSVTKCHQFGVLHIPRGARVRGRSLVRGGDDERPVSQRPEME